VYSTEVEQVLYKYPELLEAAVIGLRDEVWGEKAAAVVVSKPGVQLDHEEIKSFCRKELAGYKVPRIIFEYKEIPRNASGKILKYKPGRVESFETLAERSVESDQKLIQL
jgi:feruloyl-CoA synthase